MRKIAVVFIISIIMLMGFNAYAAAEVRVITEGRDDDYPHYLDLKVSPVIENDTYLLPLRAIAEDLGFQVDWNPAAANDITVTGDNKTIRIIIGSEQINTDSLPIIISPAPRVIEGSTMVPVCFFTELLDYFIEYSNAWDNISQIFITPYTLVSDSQIALIDDADFSRIKDNTPDMKGYVKMQLKRNKTVFGGIQLSGSIKDVLQVFGVPRSPYQNLNYPGDWSGKLVYWGTFVPQSGLGTFLEFTFDQGLLTNFMVCY
ncbi:MAG: copper amine oxidase N-terminal domain-containing protein [Syntrophomonas sp.]|nr:copper amine oxidase N-terminal domain-containing protein [Syntrophomonas sp.]